MDYLTTYAFFILKLSLLPVWGVGFFMILFLILGPSYFAYLKRHRYRHVILILNVAIGWNPIFWYPLFKWANRETYHTQKEEEKHND